MEKGTVRMTRRAKQCARCKLTKVLECFPIRKRKSGRLHPQAYCHGCQREVSKISQRKRYWDDPEKHRATAREWKAKNRVLRAAANKAYRLRMQAASRDRTGSRRIVVDKSPTLGL